ncbi:hypothetical protein BH23VER1_BH23VER1_35450 [soil metagenome]
MAASLSRSSAAERWVVGLVAAGLMALAGAAGAPAPEFATDAMSDDELREFRNAKRKALARLLKTEPTVETSEGEAYQVFYCTVYYTPAETGFTAELGFDDTPTRARGTGGRLFPKDFLRAVKMEGFGRVRAPDNGRAFLRYAGNGRYAFAKAPLGSHNNVLNPRLTCAVSRKNPFLERGDKIVIDSEVVRAVMGTDEWEVEDTGGGIHPLQIDLYWGEDDPMGAVGRQRARPAGTKLEYAFEVKVRVIKEGE